MSSQPVKRTANGFFYSLKGVAVKKKWKYSEDDYRILAESKNVQWLDSIPKNTKSDRRCSCLLCDHVWTSSYKIISMSVVGCPMCARQQRIRKVRVTPGDYHAVASQHGFSWLGPYVKTTGKATWWECGTCGHRWEAYYHNIRKGSTCPECRKILMEKSAKKRIYGTEDGLPIDSYTKLAESRGYKWIGKNVSSPRKKTTWLCSDGHEWKASYKSLKAGSGCSKCGYRSAANNRRLKPHDYHCLARSMSFTWVGNPVKTAHHFTEWKCEEGHVFRRTYSGMNISKSCPLCAGIVNGYKVSAPQLKIHKMMGGVLNKRFETLSIDVAVCVSGKNIAIEYDGWHWHKKKIDSDIRKSERLIRAGWKVLRIKSGTNIPSLEDIVFRIDELVSGSDYQEIIMEDWGH